MDFKEVIWIVVIFCCFACVVSNETVQLTQRCKVSVAKAKLINSGESSEANGYKVLHDFNFPDVTYPTTALESCQPFYFNTNGLDAIVGPFSSDVQSNYRSLLSPSENRIKDVAAKKSIADNIQYQTSFSNITTDNNKNESHNAEVLVVVRKLFKKYIENNDVDSELKEILSVLFDENLTERSSEFNEIGTVIEDSVQFLDEIIGSNLTTNISNDENITESIEHLIDRLYEPNIVNSVIEEIIQILDKNLDNHLFTNESTEENTVETVEEYIPRYTNSSNSDDTITVQPLSNKTTLNGSSDITLELELTKEDIEYLLLNNTSNDVSYSYRSGIIDVNTSISQDTGIEPIKVNIDDLVSIPELIILPEIELNNQHFNKSLLNENFNVTQVDGDQVNNYQNVEVYEVVNDSNNLNNSTIAENIGPGDSIDTDDGSFPIPKEPVIFDVVYRDAYNLEKPVLDIVPSSIPVRLKINIEIVKHDSNEIVDYYKTDLNNGPFAPRIYENNIDLENVSNNFDNTEEDLAAEEQITVLDEINESDFINALSILLLDSLNNNPLEIIPPEFINTENNSCNLLLEQSSNNLLMNHINLTNNIDNEDRKPVTAPETTLPIDSDMEQVVLEMDSNMVTYKTNPLIEMLRPVITADKMEDGHKSSVTEINTDYLKSNNNENEAIDELDNIDLSLENRNTTTTTQDFVSLNNATCIIKLIEGEHIINNSSINTTDTNTTRPLVEVFQLKISSTEVDLSD